MTRESLQHNVCVQQRLEFIVVNGLANHKKLKVNVTFFLRAKHTKKYSEDPKTTFACANHL